MSNIKTLVVITCYVNSQAKLNYLKLAIESFKKLNFDILLCSHASLPEDVIKSVNYYIFDADNTFNEINFYTSCWWANSKFKIEILSTPEDKLKDHGFLIVKNLRTSFALASYLNYDYVVASDFDNHYDDEDLEKIKKIYNFVTENKKKFFAFFPEREIPWLDMYFFIIEPKFLLNLIDSFFPKTIEEYNRILTYEYPYALEHFFANLVKPYVKYGYIINDYAKGFFKPYNIDKSKVVGVTSHIVADEKENFYLVIIADQKESFKIQIKKNGEIINHFFVYDDYVICYVFTESCQLNIDIFNSEGILEKTQDIIFDADNKSKYLKNKITFA